MDASPNPFTPSVSPPLPERDHDAQVEVEKPTPPLPTTVNRSSFPDPQQGSDRYVGPDVKTGDCCEKDRAIGRGEEISIVDAYKTTDGGKSTYITYVIRLGTQETRRRYSAFDSLRTALSSLYPVLIVPPIPSKQSLTDYAVKGQSKAKEDATVIARRKRLLEDWLRRVARHPILGGEHVFHRFLEEGISWNEVLHSPPLSQLPKNPLHAPSHNPTFQYSATSSSEPTEPSYIAHHLLPAPSASHPLRHPEKRFSDSEAFTEKSAVHLASMEKVNRRTVKRWGELAQDRSDLGGAWNGFSLVQSEVRGDGGQGVGEGDRLGLAVEKVGQAVDAEYLTTAALLQQWERSATEPLHVYSQFSQIIRQRLAFRHQKHVQHELVQDALEASRDKLETLEQAEREARRLDEALERGGRVEVSEEERELERERLRRVAGRGGGGGGQSFGLLGAVKHSISGMMDHDPEATRRANIGKLRENITQLEDSLQASTQDLKYASSTLQADLDRFQRQKVADLRKLSIDLANIHREWCRKNLDAWKKAKAAVDEIETHPNDAAAGAGAGAGTGQKPRVPVKDFRGKRRESDEGQGLEKEYGAGEGYGIEASRQVLKERTIGHPNHDEALRASLDVEQAAQVPLPLAEDGPLGPL